MVKTESGARFHGTAGSFKQIESPYYICLYECRRTGDGAIDMRFGSQMYNTVYIMRLKTLLDLIVVTNIDLFKVIVFQLFKVMQIGRISGVCQTVSVDEPIMRILSDKQKQQIGADESGPAGNQYISFKVCYEYPQSFRFLV